MSEQQALETSSPAPSSIAGAAPAPGASSSSSSSAPPAYPPREVTARVRSRAWTEPHVRFWWMAAAVLFLIGVYFVISQYLTLRRQAWLVREGTVVQALVLQAGSEEARDKLIPPDNPVSLEFEWPAESGRKVRVQGYLEGRTEHIPVKGLVPIRIDPNNPRFWTARIDPAPATWRDWLAALIVLPIAAVVFAAGVLKRRRLLRLWRDGEAIPAAALDSRLTALAPRSRAVRVVPTEAVDRRVRTVYLPSSAPVPQGERLWILLHPDNRGGVAAAAWFQG